MPGFGHFPELVLVLVIALIVFGPSKLPEVAGSIGKGLRELRRATSEIEDAVLRGSEPDTPEEFPHVPPAPLDSLEGEPAPTIDTLAVRRAQRLRARKPAGTAEEPIEESPPPPDDATAS